MAWTYVGGSGVGVVTSGNVVVTEPAGVASGDLMVAYIPYVDAPPTVPTGWTLVADSPNTGAVAMGIVVAWIIRGALPPSLTFARTGGTKAGYWVGAWTPPAGTVALEAYSATLPVATTTTTPSTPGFTTANANVLLVNGAAHITNGGDTLTAFSNSGGASWTTAQVSAGSNAAPRLWIATGYAEQAIAGATGTIGSTWAIASRFHTFAVGFYASAGGGGVTAALTGEAATGATGSTSPATDVPLTGVAASGAVGTVTASTSYGATLTGVSATGGAGNVAPSTSIALTGVAATGAVGTVARQSSVALTGVSASGGVGSVKANTTIALSGVAATGAVGTVAVGTDVVVALTGVAAIGVAGTVTAVSPPSIDGGGGWRYPNWQPYLMKKEWEEKIPAPVVKAIERVARSEKTGEQAEQELRLEVAEWDARYAKMLRELQESQFQSLMALRKQQLAKIEADEQDDEEALILLLA